MTDSLLVLILSNHAYPRRKAKTTRQLLQRPVRILPFQDQESEMARAEARDAN